MSYVDGQTIPEIDRQELFAAALDSLSAHVVIVGQDGRIVAVNRAWLTFAAANGADLPSVSAGAQYCGPTGETDDAGWEACEGVRRVLSGELAEFRHEYPCHSPTQQRWFEMRATAVMAGGGAVIVHTDITERKETEQKLAFMANHDELTGLANRRHMLQALDAAQRSGRLGIVLADVDHFKEVNDTYGHAAGNDVLCAIADALSVPLPGGSLAGRHGGDEFSVALFDVGRDALEDAVAVLAERVGERLSRMPAAAPTTLSIGATLVSPGELLEDAVNRADEALYDVKRSGRAGARVV